MQPHPTNAKLSLKTYLNFALTYYTNNVLRQENKMKLIWVKVEPKDIEPQLRWSKETGWVEKTKPTEPIYVLRQESK